ncbi:uncharacterized protein V2V93DRAFT_383780 [Kockiozyma suomiensis]|uniref:uncharacterized protein n=1 Tax=Kockiozyma suomiensis TaxID=1337062 RepID=UPI003343BCA6
MAGGHGPTSTFIDSTFSVAPVALHRDPAIDKHYALRENYESYFRWTPKNARYAFAFLVIIPGALLYTAYRTDGAINFEGKKRGSSIYERH